MPYKKDGMHYFKSITWRNPGEYRLTFFLLNPHPSRGEAVCAALIAEPLARTVIVTDPEFEARHAAYSLEATAEEMEAAAVAAERSAAYATAAPTKRERCGGSEALLAAEGDTGDARVGVGMGRGGCPAGVR